MTGPHTHVITGGAGFIAVNLARELLDQGDQVWLIDNLSRGRKAFVDALPAQDRVRFRQADVSIAAQLDDALAGIDEFVQEQPIEVWHLCANSDIPAGVNDPEVDLKDTFLVTHRLLTAMRARGWKVLHFASTSAVYGDHGETSLTEQSVCQPISNYGAMKLASEAAIHAAAEFFLERVNIFRFPNVVGIPATHGVILDFLAKLRATPELLKVLGNGTQRKAYLHVSDLIAGMLQIRMRQGCGTQTYNIGPPDDGITVREIAQRTRDIVAPEAQLEFGTEGRGWIGDVPRFSYDISKLASIGWTPSLSSHEAINRAICEIREQEQIVTTAPVTGL